MVVVVLGNGGMDVNLHPALDLLPMKRLNKDSLLYLGPSILREVNQRQL